MKNQALNRRRFMQQATVATMGAAFIPQIVSAANPSFAKTEGLKKGSVILFQGDSITDAGRRKESYFANQADGMGFGYVLQTAGRLMGQNPQGEFRIYNRGISGNKVYQLAARWEEDCLQIGPDVLSLLIGVNDYWHTLTGGYKGTVEVYESDLRKLLDRTLAGNPGLKLILAEPFAVKGGTAIDERWEDFQAYREASRKIATDYKAVFIPLHGLFEKALEKAPASFWCPDGVHPSMAGGYLMAEAWMEAFGKLG
ncbi:MAG: SGNH/GDSL hydrolase family protein [Lewinella sp.]|nr:SGNH/GDSL hydrolase family protein [Lewinella sp.]